jgi:hypothetical protein
MTRRRRRASATDPQGPVSLLLSGPMRSTAMGYAPSTASHNPELAAWAHKMSYDVFDTAEADNDSEDAVSSM